jgi:hypothetical protein
LRGLLVQLPFTHLQLAEMIAARRSTVSAAARRLVAEDRLRRPGRDSACSLTATNAVKEARGVSGFLADGTLRCARNASAPDFSQRLTLTVSSDANAITGQAELSNDGADWQDDLAITYRRVG